jgi:hypothetical protein
LIEKKLLGNPGSLKKVSLAELTVGCDDAEVA